MFKLFRLHLNRPSCLRTLSRPLCAASPATVHDQPSWEPWRATRVKDEHVLRNSRGLEGMGIVELLEIQAVHLGASWEKGLTNRSILFNSKTVLVRHLKRSEHLMLSPAWRGIAKTCASKSLPSSA